MKKVLLAGLIAACAVFAENPKKTTEKPTEAQKQAKEETTPQVDLVCGMTVEPKTAEGKYVYKGKTYYFCSKDDQQEFAKAPDKYVKK